MENITKYCKGYNVGDYNVKYDIRVLYNLQPEINTEIKKIIISLREKQNGPLIEMLFRYMNKISMPSIKILQGPISITYLTSKQFPHRIYIFGDRHVTKAKCVSEYPINKLIVDCTKKLPVFIDVFLESEYKYTKEGISIKISESIFEGNYLEQTEKEFDPSCFTHLKQNCNLLTSRIHYTDMRWYFNSESENKLFRMLQQFKALTYIKKRDKKLYEHYKPLKLKKFMDNLDFLDDHLSNKEKLIEMLTKGPRTTRLLKQIKNIPVSSIRKILETYMQDEIFFRTVKLYGALGKFESITTDNYEDILSSIGYNLINFTETYMDVYLLARIFRTFNNVPHKYSEPAYNCIVYVGNMHAMTYIDLLKKMGFDIIFQIKNESQCLDISKLPQPLFNL